MTGTLWFIGVDEPVLLDLEGNPHRDLAGTTLVFEHPEPELDTSEAIPNLEPILRGVAGDITASKKVFLQENIFDTPNSAEPSLVNALCIEWYDDQGERFAIDSVAFCLYAGEPEWQMDEATDRQQREHNTRRFHQYIDSIANRSLGEDGSEPIEDEQPLDEFEWEERLKESDRITQAYMEALDKFQDLPDQERLVSAAMGWNQSGETERDWRIESESSMPAGDEDLFGADDDDEEFDNDPWLESDPFDEPNHPLYERAYEFSVRLHREVQEFEPDDDSGTEISTPLQSLVFAAMDLSAKLAGALNGIGGPGDSEPGFVVATLKRGLPIVDRGLGAIGSAQAQSAAPGEWLDGVRTELFEIRASMLDLIQEFRRQLP